MDGLGNQLLAGAAFAADENGGARRCDLRNQIEQREHFVALADDVGEVVALLERALELNIFFAQAAAFDGLRDLQEQLVVRPRLGDVVLCAALERGASHVDRAVRGDQNDRKRGIAVSDFAEHVETVAVGQTDVEQEEIERVVLKLSQALAAGFGAGYDITFRAEQEFQTFADFALVINDEDRAFRHAPPFAQRGTPGGTECRAQARTLRQSCPHVL